MKKISVINFVFLLSVALFFGSCASLFMPRKQKVTFVTGDKNSKIYLEKDELGNGPSVSEKLAKDGAKQIIIKKPDHKDSYQAIVQTHRPIAYWCLQPLNALNFFYGLTFDMIAPKNMAYDRTINLEVGQKLVNRGTDDKYIDISNIKLDINKKDRDINVIYLRYESNLKAAMEDADKDLNVKYAAEDARKAKKAKKGKGTLTNDEDQKIKYDDTKFSYNVYRTLKRTGFVDTVNRVFTDNNNTLILEGSMSKITFYVISGRRGNGAYVKSKVNLKWYIKNTYGEILDSVTTSEYSGDFVLSYLKDGDSYQYEKIVGDAVDISYLKLHQNAVLSKYIKQENNFNISDANLTLNSPKSAITDKSDAALASVIIKTKDGHGSGFAITQDGYIITNYHVIAGKFQGKPNSVKVLNSNGEEMEGTIVRYNKYRDIALIKVNKSFEKAFKVNNVKSFKNLQDVYTIGAPKSIELGQSISAGVISNERKNNNNHLLQLGMSVNGGNSGGPLFDAAGTLHGVIVMKLVGQNTEGVSFAIPGFLIEEYLKVSYQNDEVKPPSGTKKK